MLEFLINSKFIEFGAIISNLLAPMVKAICVYAECMSKSAQQSRYYLQEAKIVQAESMFYY